MELREDMYLRWLPDPTGLGDVSGPAGPSIWQVTEIRNIHPEITIERISEDGENPHPWAYNRGIMKHSACSFPWSTFNSWCRRGRWEEAAPCPKCEYGYPTPDSYLCENCR